ncbi:hypothetical protein ACOMHN_006950 [Nucella lapillus]
MSPREEVTPGGVEVGSTECSLGPCRLPYLQRFAQPLPFTLILSLCSFSSTLMAPLFATQVTSLERQFELTSTQVGGLQSANDVGFLILVLVVAHFGKHSHTPRILALGTLIFGLAAFGISATNFLYPQSLKDLLSESGEDHDHYLCLNSTTTNSSLGSSRNRNHTCEGGGGGGSGDSRMHVVILIGVLFSLQGVAKATRNPLGVSYIDDNVPNRAKTGLYVDTAITSKDPRWISAWWLGFLIPATLSLIFALPLSCFPKRLTNSSGSQEDSQKSQQSTDFYQDDHHLPGEKEEHVCKDGDGEMPQQLPPSLCRLLGSPVYVLMILALALKIFAIFGFASFFIKFLHHTFDLEPRLGSYIFGGSSLVLNSLGTFSGGLLTTRVLKTRRHCLQYILIIHATSIVLTCTTIFLGCDARHIHFSGCKLSALEMVSVGVCSPGCKYLVPFIIVQVLSSAVRASSITPIYVIIISPIVYGAIVDTTCLLWTSSCGRPGACALYDVTQLRFRYIGLEICGNVAAFLCSCLALTVLLWQIRTGRTEDDKLTAAGNMEVFVEEKRGNGKGGQGTECKDGVVVTRF